MASTKATALSATALCLAAAMASYGRNVFEESFKNYGDTAPGVTRAEGLTVGNDPIWVNAAELNVKVAAPCKIFEKDIALPADNKFDVLTKFRFLNSTMPKKGNPEKNEKDVAGVASFFDIVFKTANGKSQKITIAADAVAGQKLLFPGNTNALFIANWKWEEVAVKANGANADIFVSKDRAFYKITSVKLDGVFETVNFAASPEKQFSLRDVVVRTPEGIRGYPVEKHFASFKSLNQPIADAKVATGTETNAIATKPMAGVRFVPGNAKDGTTKFVVTFSDGTSADYPVTIGTQGHNLMTPFADKAKNARIDLADSFISIKGIGEQYVRPLMRNYCSSYDMEPQGLDILRDWNRLPPASQHPLDVNFIRKDGAAQVYVDGSFITTIAGKDGATVTDIKFLPAKGVKYVLSEGDDLFGSPRFTAIDMSKNPRAKAFSDATYTEGVKTGLAKFDGVPVMVAAPIDSADVAICKQGKGSWALEVEEYHGRSPLWGFPSAIHYRLPAADYAKAHILFAIDPDAHKDKILTVRLGYYVTNGVGGNMLGDAIVEFKDGKVPFGCKEVGKIKRGNQELPVYFMTVDLGLGNVIDIAARKGYIDFEFSGKGWENFEQLNNEMKPDPNSDSAFNIFGVTLEKAPVVVDFRQEQPANVFTANETVRKTTVLLKAAIDGAKGCVRWVAKDIKGLPVFTGKQDFALAKAGDTSEISIDLGASTPKGFYTLDVTLDDADGNALFTHNARFAILPEAGRKVGKVASPYATWWFNSHGSPGDIELGGPLMQKAGIRKASWRQPNAEECAKYDITGVGNIGAPGMRDFDTATGKFKPSKIDDPADPEKDPRKRRKIEIDGEETFVRKVQAAIDEHKKNGRHADHMLIWHESAPGYGIPEELLGLPVPAVPENDRNIAKYVNEVGRIMRKHFPQIKLQFGNSSASIGAAVRPLRAGANPQYYDYMGFETPAQVIKPEKMQECGFQGMRVTLDIAEKLAKRPVKGNGSWEFTYRCERDMGEQQQAEWYMRDVLISLANDFFLISPGIFFDCSSGYYNGLWGGSGILLRGPYGYPKRAYVAYAVLTKCLDGVKFVRQLDTGSTTVYAIEFKRTDGKTATALWAARGDVDFVVDSASTGTWTEMYGTEYAIPAGKSIVKGGTSPVYVVTDSPLKGVSIGKRTFPKEMDIALRARVADKVDDIRDFTLEPDPSLESTHTGFLPILRPSDFSLAQADDAEKGACVEIALNTDSKKYDSRYITEYTTLRFKEPKAIPGTPSVIGVWVKGNSNWGQIRFEIEDANGEVFKNLSTGRSWGCDIMDWPGNLCVDFDGWSYVYQSLAPNKIVNDHSPGPYSDQWVSEGGDKKIQFPVKVRAITVGMYRYKLDLLDFKPASPAIRLRDVGGL